MKKKWMHFRHRIMTELVRITVGPFGKLKYHIKVDWFKEQGDRNWLILANHQTDFDQFFVGMAFRNPVYYVAMEDLFSNGFISKVISYLIAPIPFMKATSDVKAVMTCMRIAKEGGNIAIFPEGNRTYSGRTCYIKPSVAALAKKLGLPIALFRIEGGYGVRPRWADKNRKGRMTAGVRRVIEPEEYRDMSKEELYDLICRELDVDETKVEGEYPCKAAAEHLERVLYVCPDCGLSRFDSRGDRLTCQRCGKEVRYLPNKQFSAPEGETPFRYVADWYDYQEAFIRGLDLSPYLTKPMYEDAADVREVIVYDRKRPMMKNAAVRLFGDRLEMGDMVLPYEEIKAMSCIAGHKLNIFFGEHIYQLRGDAHFNALKYCNIYYHAKYIKEGHEDGKFQFLGL